MLNLASDHRPHPEPHRSRVKPLAITPSSPGRIQMLSRNADNTAKRRLDDREAFPAPRKLA